jgi:hypothetical protein
MNLTELVELIKTLPIDTVVGSESGKFGSTADEIIKIKTRGPAPRYFTMIISEDIPYKHPTKGWQCPSDIFANL